MQRGAVYAASANSELITCSKANIKLELTGPQGTASLYSTQDKMSSPAIQAPSSYTFLKPQSGGYLSLSPPLVVIVP